MAITIDRLVRTGQYNDHMVMRVTATEAKAKLPALLDRVEAGEDVEITRHGRPVARMTPARGPLALRGIFKGIVTTAPGVTDEELFSTGAKWNVERRRPR